MTTTFHVVPTYHHTSSGWVLIDPTVNPNADATHPFSAEGAVRPIRFGTSASDLVEIALDNGPITITAPGMNVTPPLPWDNGVAYQGVASAANFQYTVMKDRLQESIILDSAAAPTSFTFHIADPNGQLGGLQQAADGGYVFNALIDGQVRLELPPPNAYKAASTSVDVSGNVTVSTDEVANPGSARESVTTAGNGYDVTESVDPAWLAGQSFPVVLDPTIRFGDNNNADGAITQYSLATIQANGGCYSDCSSVAAGYALGVGGYYPYVGRQTYLQYNLSRIAPGSTVQSAQLQTSVVGCWRDKPSDYQCNNNDYLVYFLGMTGSWVWNQTWNQLNTTLTANNNAAWSAKWQYRFNDPNPWPCSPCANANTWLDDDGGFTTPVQNWINNPSSNHGFGALAGAPGATCWTCGGPVWQYQSACALPSSPNNECLTGGFDPVLIVSYSPPPPPPPGPGLTKSIVNPQPFYSKGQLVTYSITANNPAASAITVSDVTDNLPAGLRAVDPGTLSAFAPASHVVTLNNGPCPTSGAPITCSLTPTQFSSTGFQLAAGASATFTFPAVVTGVLDRACSQVSNQAVMHANTGTALSGLVPVTLCDVGLGYENWWTYVNQDLGAGGKASVNVANGNLVVQVVDSTPVQAHGRFAYVLRRTYNSQDTTNVLSASTLNIADATPIGAGWRLNIDQVGNGIGDGVVPDSLLVPSVQSVLDSAFDVTLVDEDGTHHVFTPNALTASVGGNLQLNPIDVTPGSIPSTSALYSLASTMITGLDSGYDHLCVDETFNAPAGVHLALWRYLEVKGQCSSPSASPFPVVVGFAGMRPDRIRYEFSLDGHVLTASDGAGVQLKYNYNNLPAGTPVTVPVGHLSSVDEPRSCPSGATPGTPACRGFVFNYPSLTETVVTDPGGRSTRYLRCGDPNLTSSQQSGCTGNELVTVKNVQAGTAYTYAYGGASACLAPFSGNNQLCSASDLNGQATTFAYSAPASLLGLAQVTKVVDRPGHETDLSYSHPPSQAVPSCGTTTTDYLAATRFTAGNPIGEQQRFSCFDGTGSAGEIDQGGTDNTFHHQTLNFWDTGGRTTCVQPTISITGNTSIGSSLITNVSGSAGITTGSSISGAGIPSGTTVTLVVGTALAISNNATASGTNVALQITPVDHDLCRSFRYTGNGAATAEDTSYTYNPEGQLLIRAACLNATDPGAGVYPPPACPSAPLSTTYGYQAEYCLAASCGQQPMSTVSDSVAGNGQVTSQARPLAPAVYVLSDKTQSLTARGNQAGGAYAQYETHYSDDANPNASPNTVQSGGFCGSTAYNSGLLCSTSEPLYDGSHPTVTTNQYDTFGQKTQMTNPNGNTYTYTYYADTDTDLSTATEAGGWLKAVTDPTGNFVAFAYDQAGNRVRTWDRNATHGHTVAQFPGPAGAPTNSQYSQTTYGSGSTPFATPWRYVLSQSDPLGNLTTFTVDGNGNQSATRPPRGNVAGNASFDTTQQFDASDELLSTTQPLDPVTGIQPVTRATYDAYGNRISSTNADGIATDYVFDTVNRLMSTEWTRGPWVSSDAMAYPACRQSVSGDAPIQPGRLLCSNNVSYDMLDNKTAAQDGNGQTTSFAYDGAHRQIRQQVPRNDGTLGLLTTGNAYDADGRVTDSCPPRQYSEGGMSVGSPCPASAVHGTHHTYDLLGRLSTTFTYRVVGSTTQQDTETFTYDGDGNQRSDTNADGFMTQTFYDQLDRKVRQDVPRSAGAVESTATLYDPAGDVTAVVQPGSLVTGNGSAGNLVVDGVTAGSSSDHQAHPQSNPYVLPPWLMEYGSVTLQNGGWIEATNYYYDGTYYHGGMVDFEATGPVVICSTCGVIVTGRGPAGGRGGMPGRVSGTTVEPGSAGGGGDGWGSGPGGGLPGGGGGLGGGGATIGAGGGGGAHAVNGSPGSAPQAQGGTPGVGGSAYGLSNLNDVSEYYKSMGAGGGGGGGGEIVSGAAGGQGGGFVRVVAPSIDLEGSILADGGAGGAPCRLLPTKLVTICETAATDAGGGGGGGGGTVWLAAPAVTFGTANVISVAGGAGYNNPNGGSGGAGGAGRVRIDSDTITGTAGGSSAWGSSFTSGMSRITAYSYDAAHRPVDTVVGSSSTDASQAGTASPDGAFNVRTRQTYDPDGHVVARYEPRAFASSVTSPDQRFVTRTDYNTDGRAVAQYVPRYDSNDSQYADPGMSPAQVQQCPTGAPAYGSSIGVCITRLAYDGVGNATKLTLPTALGGGNRYIAYGYTDDNLLATRDAPSPSGAATPACPVNLGQSGARADTCFTYDADGKQLTVTDPLGNTTATSYNSDETVKEVDQPGYGSVTHSTKSQYDANGNQIASTDPSGNVTQTGYFTDNLKNSITVGANISTISNKTSYLYDGVGNPLNVFSPSATARDATNPGGVATVNTYTQDNLLQTSTVPVSGSASRQTTYSYDDAGRKTEQAISVINPPAGQPSDGGHLRFSYMADDRLLSEIGRAGEALTYQYDPAGHQTSVNESTHNYFTSATYYLDGRLRTSGDSYLYSDIYAYDGAGSEVSTSLNGNRIDYVNNDAGLLADEVASLSYTSSTGRSDTAMTYDAAGRTSVVSDPNGVQTASTYNPDNTLACQSTTMSGSVLSTNAYDYYNDFLRKDQYQSLNNCGTAPPGPGAGGDFAYVYDAANRLASFQNGTASATPLTWDHNSNRTSYGSTTFTYNADNSIATDSSAASAYSYDADGRLTSDGCGATNYRYDGFDRLYQAGLCGPQGITYAYDGMGRQVNVFQSGNSTSVLYRGLSNTVATEATSGQQPVNYVTTPAGLDTAVVRSWSPAQYLNSDGAGSVELVSNGSGGQVCANRFDPFGNVLNNTCSAAVSPSTHFWQDVRQEPNGQYQLGSRTYDPAKGAFITPDVFQAQPSTADLSIQVDPLTENRYTYVNGDPVNLVDPNGHDPWWQDQAGYHGPVEHSFGTSGCPQGGALCTISEHNTYVRTQGYRDSQTSIGLTCMHYLGSNLTCSVVTPWYEGMSSACMELQSRGGDCSTLATLYGEPGHPATSDSQWVSGMASGLTQLFHDHPNSHELTAAEADSALLDLASLAGGWGAGKILAWAGGKLFGWVADVLRGSSSTASEDAGLLQQTVHGLSRAADASRLDPGQQVDVISNATKVFTQSNGAQVFVQEVDGKFNVVVMGDSGVVTNLKTISQSSLDRLANRYGWTPS